MRTAMTWFKLSKSKSRQVVRWGSSLLADSLPAVGHQSTRYRLSCCEEAGPMFAELSSSRCSDARGPGLQERAALEWRFAHGSRQVQWLVIGGEKMATSRLPGSVCSAD